MAAWLGVSQTDPSVAHFRDHRANSAARPDAADAAGGLLPTQVAAIEEQNWLDRQLFGWLQGGYFESQLRRFGLNY